MDRLEFEKALRAQGLEAALRALFVIIQNLRKTVDELYAVVKPPPLTQAPAANAPVVEEGK